MIIQGLDHLDQGITIFDENLKLSLFNKKFQTMFDFPDELIKIGIDFADIIRFNIENNEYGPGDADEQLTFRLERAKKFTPHRFNRKRPNGITIDISGTPLPDGGFVTIYTDVTEYAARVDDHKREKEQSDALLKATLENISQGISLIDLDLHLAVSNHRFLELLDLPKNFSDPTTTFEEITRYNAERGEYGPGDVEEQVAARLNLAKEMQPHRFIRERPDGTIIDVIGRPLPGIGFVTTYEDVTDSENTKRSIEEREEQFRTYLEVSPVGALLVEMDGTIRYFNSRLRDIFGYNEEDMEKITALDLYQNPEERNLLLKEIEDENKTATLRTMGKKKNNVTFPILITTKKIQLKGHARIFSWVYDLTDLTEAEETIQRLSEQNQLILSAAGAGIFGIDNEGHIQFINPAAAKFLEYEADDLKGAHISKLFKKKLNIPDLMTSQSFAGETEMLRKSGSLFPIKFTVTRLEEQDRLSGLVIVFDDISDRIAAEEVLRQAMSDIETSSRAKSHFLSTMSHELRTPLNAILGFAQILEKNQDNNLNQLQLNFIDHLHRAGNHLLKLVNEAIDIATIESGQIILSNQAIELRELIENCLKLTTDMAIQKKVIVKPTSYPEEELSIIADHERLQQIILHLISNAIKYNIENGYIEITCTPKEDKIRIIVKDTGNGIPEDERTDIFAPFNRLDSPSKGIEGTGLGLTLSKHLCEIMGGKIGFTTELGKGSSFWIEFPYVKKGSPVLGKNT